MPTTSVRTHGRNARLYVGIASGSAAPSPTLFHSSFDIQASTDQMEVTAWGDTGKTYLVGLPDAKGTYTGFYDVGGADLYTAALDGTARKFYFYPDTTGNVGVYFFGTAFFDQSIQFSVSDASKVTGNWTAASSIIKVVP
jgi:hypothetical protein